MLNSSQPQLFSDTNSDAESVLIMPLLDLDQHSRIYHTLSVGAAPLDVSQRQEIGTA